LPQNLANKVGDELAGRARKFYISAVLCVIPLRKREELAMLKMKKISDTFDMKVFTDSGDYFGDIEEAILALNKVYGWRVRATKNSFLSKVLGSAKGVVVPHQLVKAVGDIMIISKAAVPSYSEEGEEEASVAASEAA